MYRSYLETILLGICDNLQLAPSLYTQATERYTTIAKTIQQDPAFNQITLNMYPHGSFRLKTTVKPLSDDEFDSKSVKVFVVNPEIKYIENRKKVPHLYSDGSLCLHYPNYNEWSFRDSWVETLIPWTSLWLFYYEIWKETGQWLGGGIHGKKNISPV